MAKAFLETERLELRPLVPEDATPAYLAWLNDAEVLRYRGPRAFPTSGPGLSAYLASIAERGDLVLAIRVKETSTHIGNIALNSILWTHGSAELSIMIGDRDAWGKGFAKEAIGALTRHAFETMRLHRLWAESPNPAFNAAVASLGWVKEGTKREAFFLDGSHVDIVCYGLLRDERDEDGMP